MGATPVQTSSLASSSLFPVGTTTNTFAAGGNVVCSFNVTVIDKESPVLTCPTIPPQCYNNCGTYMIAPLAATDNCGISSITYAITGATFRTGSSTNASGSFGVGTSTITWTVTDVHNNVNTCQTTVTVNSQLLVTIPGSIALSSGVNVNTV